MGFVDTLRPADVTDPKAYANYVAQVLGTPYAYKDTIILRKKIKEFFELYPNANYFTLCRIVEWAKAKKKRPAHCYYVVDMARYAWSDGMLPELDPNHKETDDDLEKKIYDALQIEQDRNWRYRLIGAQGVEARREVFNEWMQHNVKVAS